MKTIQLFDRELKFDNESLYMCAELAINKGYRVHTFNPSGNVISQIFIDNGKTFGSIQSNYGCVQYSTCHKATKGIGTGFGFYQNECSCADIEKIEKTLSLCPSWVAPSDRCRVVKQTWEQHQSEPITQILKYAEIKL